MRYPCYYNYLINGPDTFYCIISELPLEILLSCLLPGLYTALAMLEIQGELQRVWLGFPELVFPASLPLVVSGPNQYYKIIL